jgi:predicted DNA-binding transcriptional regulator AlpA
MAALLRTTRKAIYAQDERRQLPGVVRIGRRLLFRRDDIYRWLGLC